MISVPWPLRPAPPLAPAPLLALSEPPRARSPELPDPLEPDPPERDCSLFVDSRDWAIDHSFFENWERPGGRPPERSSPLLRHGRASRKRNGLLRPISHKLCPSIARSDFLFTKSVCPWSFRHGDVYVRTWHAMCIAVTEQAGTITRLPSLLFYEESRFSPFPPLALVPNRDPGCHPGRGLTLFPHRSIQRRPRPHRACYGSRS
jgi:hypothetical protein